jgi:hypothetical protein
MSRYINPSLIFLEIEIWAISIVRPYITGEFEDSQELPSD